MGIGRPGEIGDAFRMADEAVAESEGRGRPDDKGFVERGRS